MNDLQTANETIGSLRTLLHHAEQDKRRLAAEVERLKNELCDYLDIGDRAVDAARLLKLFMPFNPAAIELRERIEAWHERLEAQELEAVH